VVVAGRTEVLPSPSCEAFDTARFVAGDPSPTRSGGP